MSPKTGTKRSQSAGAPSLLDPKATGGLVATTGFEAQTRYLACQVPTWLADPSFDRVVPERAEDFDAFFRDAGSEHIDHYQVKVEALTPAVLKSIAQDFAGRYRSNIDANLVRRYVLVAPRATASVRSLFEAMERARSTSFALGEANTTAAATEADLAARWRAQKIESVFPVCKRLVRLETAVVGLATREEALDVLTARLGRMVVSLRGLPTGQLRIAAERLLTDMAAAGRREWKRADLESLMRGSIEAAVIGPPRLAGDVALIAHQTLAPATQPFHEVALPEELKDRRRIPLGIDGVALLDAATRDDLEKAVSQVAAADSDLRRVLRQDPPLGLVYYGFPHIPLAVLAGAIVGQQRPVRPVEHQRDSGKFEWQNGEPDPRLLPPDVTHGTGDASMLRLSISAPVRRELCEVGRPVGGEVHISAETPGRGIVRTEKAARAIIDSVRRALDTEVSGRAYTSLHVFAAIPVSVAVLLGQVLSATGLPPIYVYNFNQKPTPRYRWRLAIEEGRRGAPSVELL